MTYPLSKKSESQGISSTSKTRDAHRRSIKQSSVQDCNRTAFVGVILSTLLKNDMISMNFSKPSEFTS